MPQQSGVSVDNSFINGFITEATALNFPEHACTDTYDCIFKQDGAVLRRLGFDFEPSFSTKTINRVNTALSSYLWRNVSGDGSVSLLVLQVGATIYFYRTGGSNISGGGVATTISLTGVAGAPDISTIEAQFSDGNGKLFITHPYCDPVKVTYDAATDTASSSSVTIKIRDFEGSAADPYLVDERPTSTLGSLNVSHHYNLLNQGWSNANLGVWDTAQTTIPSNADVMWLFKNTSEDYDFTTTVINRITVGNTPAPRGHYILTLSNQDRDTASGLSGVTATATSYYRPATSAFFTGRLFYAGINYTGFNSKIYFTQIIEQDVQYGYCYQTNDPTSEELFDLLPTDGGVISIPDAGTIHKLTTVPGGLAVFAANGVWYVTGSSAIGFTANDYTVVKVADIPAISSTSFVNVAGFPAWWNSEGIYILTSKGNLPSVQSLTYPKIKSFFADIPFTSKRQARGTYNNIDGIIQWIYKSTSTQDVNNIYEYDRVLNFNTVTGSFYPWTISSSPVKINSIFFPDANAGLLTTNQVVRGPDNVIDGSSNNVITYSSAGSAIRATTKFIVSYPNGGSYNFTISENNSTRYLDWFSYNSIGVDFTSYFVTGFKLKGDAIRKFQSIWLKILSRLSFLDSAVAYKIRSIWDYSTSSITGRWSVQQPVAHTDLNYATATRRLKIRGHGTACQFRVDSQTGLPFDIIGWSSFDQTNQLP